MKPIERANNALDALASEYDLDLQLVSDIRSILRNLYAQTLKMKK
jgi:hypothetical protein